MHTVLHTLIAPIPILHTLLHTPKVYIVSDKLVSLPIEINPNFNGMKRILFFYMSFLFCLGNFASEKEIPLYKGHKDEWVKDDRSISTPVTATIDSNTVTIYLGKSNDKVELIIKDELNRIAYSMTSTITAYSHTFELYNLTEGTYILQFEVGAYCYYGDFYLE